MKASEFLIAILFASILAVGLSILINGNAILQIENFQRSNETAITPNTFNQPTKNIEKSSSLNSDFESSSLVVPAVGSEARIDLEDVLLLYDSNRITNFDINFCKLAEYYGLHCKKIAINYEILTEQSLRDEQGNFFKLVGISANTFLSSPLFLAENKLSMIKEAIELEGVKLLISKLQGDQYTPRLASITDGAVLGVIQPEDTKRDWILSSEFPEITREFTGQVITSSSEAVQNDYALILDETPFVTPLISSTDDSGEMYPILAVLEFGSGYIFIDAGDMGESLEDAPLRDLYYRVNDWNRGFAQVVPLMFVMRYSLGDEVWHNDYNYANLTIDDPYLTEPWNNLSYVSLFLEMQKHNFHTTIAMPPVEWTKSQSDVVQIFRTYPNYYSIAQHGNNTDGYEFYKYEVSEGDEYQGQRLPARPFEEQEMDILEGLSRLTSHRIQTGITHDRVMIFPWGISPEPTFRLLKKYNFLATINAQDVPLDASQPANWDYGMHPANLEYENFPALTRRHPGTYQPFTPELQPFIFDLFIDKPALFYTHAYESELFADGTDAFNIVADQMNQLPGNISWESLGNILKRFHLEKMNDDGSTQIRMYTSHLILNNNKPHETTYHLTKLETLNVPIKSLMVNGHEFAYQIENDVLTLDLILPPHNSVEILITYGD